MSDDPRDVTDDLGLQDARDESECDEDVCNEDWSDVDLYPYTGEPVPPWVSRHDTYEEWKGER